MYAYLDESNQILTESSGISGLWKLRTTDHILCSNMQTHVEISLAASTSRDIKNLSVRSMIELV